MSLLSEPLVWSLVLFFINLNFFLAAAHNKLFKTRSNKPKILSSLHQVFVLRILQVYIVLDFYNLTPLNSSTLFKIHFFPILKLVP